MNSPQIHGFLILNDMRKIFIVIALLSSIPLLSCDVCGCRLGGFSYGILPQHHRHIIGIRYSYAEFSARMNHNSSYFADEHSNDTYQRYDVLARVSLLEKLQINVQIPYLINTMDGNKQQVTSNGVGDPMVVGYYNLINTSDQEEALWKNSLLLGAGVKLPLGDYEKMDQGKIINRNFQLGSGSVDYLFSANYTLSLGAWGLNTDASLKLNTANDQGYTFGNQFNINSYLFRHVKTSFLTVLPYIGGYYETADQHKAGKIVQINTGGSAFFTSVGIQLYKGNFALNLLYQSPLSQKYNSDAIASIEAKDRFSASLHFNIASPK